MLGVRLFAVAATCCAALIAPGAASASIAVSDLVARPIAASATCSNTAVPAVDAPAATHRDFCVAFSFAGDETVKDLRLSLPAGVIGDPTAAPPCERDAFQAGRCTDANRVGDVSSDLTTFLLGLIPVPLTNVTGEIYNLKALPTEPARLGIQLDGGLAGLSPVRLQSPVRVRITDAGLDSVTAGVPNATLGQPIHVDRMRLTLWGTKTDHPSLQRPFVTLPTRCDADAVTHVGATGYAGGSDGATASFRPTACDKVPFTPTLESTPKQPRADEPGEASATLMVPGEDTGTGDDARRQAYVKDVRLRLPPGLDLNPPLADGLQPCTEDQFGLGVDATPQCPANTEIGTVTFTTPLFPAPLTGKVYFGTPKPGQALRNFVSVEDPRLRLKLIGDVTVDPQTGALTNVFADQPQVPFTRFKFTYNGGPHAALTSPDTCGPKAVAADMTPWNGAATVTPTDSFEVVDCPPPTFTPSLETALSSTAAGGDTALTVTVTRPDRQLRLQRMTVSLPQGLTGRLTGVPACSIDDARASACTDASRVGSVRVAVGTGPAPLVLPGVVYLTDGYDGSLAGLAIDVDASLPALDLGHVVTLAQIRLRDDTGIDVVSDPLPQRVQGFATVYRSIALTMDRPGFLRNATGCDASAVHATFAAVGGATATADAPYAATGCAALPFAPKLSARIGADGEDKPNGHPPMTITIEQGAGQAAMRRTAVTLPKGIGVDLKNLTTLCAPAQLAGGTCPAASRIGDVRAETPLLPAALTGGAYLTQGAKPGALPGLALDLGLLRLQGTVGFATGRMQTVFDGIPDVPLDRLVLTLRGGPKAPLATSLDLCTSKPALDAEFAAHSGATLAGSTPAVVEGCGGAVGATGGAVLRLSGRLSGVRRHRPSLTLTVRSGTPLARVRITLPRQLSVASRRALSRSGRLLASGKRIRRGATFTVRGHALTLRLPKGRTARTVALTLPRGILRQARLEVGTKVRVAATGVTASGRRLSGVVRLTARR